MNSISTKRLLLRPVQGSDAERIFALFNNWNVIQWLSTPPWPYTLDHAREWTSRHDEARMGGEVTHYAILFGDALVGAIGWRERTALPPLQATAPHIGYWLGEPYWGRGFMTETVQTFVHHLFVSAPSPAIYSGVFAGNIASLRLQEKIGFIRQGQSLLHSGPRMAELAHIDTILTRAHYESLSTP